MNPSKKITLAIWIGIAFVFCTKQYNVDGQVVSRHDIPVPNAIVKLKFAEGSHSCCEDKVVNSTDSNGNFSFRGAVGVSRKDIFIALKSHSKTVAESALDLVQMPNRED